MLLLDNPKRLSTDIDIMVDPGTDVKHYIEVAVFTVTGTYGAEESLRLSCLI